MVQEGWLVDMDSGYKLSLGKADSHGQTNVFTINGKSLDL